MVAIQGATFVRISWTREILPSQRVLKSLDERFPSQIKNVIRVRFTLLVHSDVYDIEVCHCRDRVGKMANNRESILALNSEKAPWPIYHACCMQFLTQPKAKLRSHGAAEKNQVIKAAFPA